MDVAPLLSHYPHSLTFTKFSVNLRTMGGP
jgi:hypothetical protein